MKMNTVKLYTIKYFKNGEVTSTVTMHFKSLRAAKMYAGKYATFDKGSIAIYKHGIELATKEFWQQIDRFGWDNWKDSEMMYKLTVGE